MNHSKIDILCYYDKHHKPLYDLFFETSFNKYLKHDFNLFSHIHTSKYNNSFFESPNWKDVILNRLDFIKDYVTNHQDQIAIYSDIDILFLDNFIEDISICFKDDTDIYYMSEYLHHRHYEINGGFFLFKCNENVLNFLNEVIRRTKRTISNNDQIVIQSFFKKRKNLNIKWSFLNPKIFITNNEDNQLSWNMINNTAKVFHCTSTPNMMCKLQTLSTITTLLDMSSNIRIKKSKVWIPRDLW